MGFFREKEGQAVEYMADVVEDFEYAEEATKTGTVAGFAGTGAALSSNKVGLGALSFALGNFSHNVSTELASRNDYEPFLDDMPEDEELEEIGEIIEEGDFGYIDEGLYAEDPEEIEDGEIVLDEDQYDRKE